jgi:hypothetical protein
MQDNQRSDLIKAANRLKQTATEMVKQLRTEQKKQGFPALPLKSEVASSQVKQSQAVLIQPQYPLDLQLPPESPVVPSALIWTSPAPHMPPKPFVVPGPVQRQMPTPVMQQPIDGIPLSTHILDVPESVRLNATGLQTPRLAPKPADSKQAATGSDTHPVAILSISTASATSDTVVVPPGNLIPSAKESEGKGGVQGSAISAAGRESSASIESVKNEQPSTFKHAAQASQAAARSTTNATAGPIPPPTSPVLAPRTGSERPALVQPQGMQYPTNGRFDIVVMQSSTDESLPPGMLNGKPVYTVYLQVGDTKDWIMHYCANNSSAIQRGGLVQLPDPRPLDAPYPRLTFRPDDPVAGPDSYILVHGMIDENGSLQNLQVVGPVRSGRSSLLEALNRWRFRPAMRGGSPEKVEMVLAIPVEKT